MHTEQTRQEDELLHNGCFLHVYKPSYTTVLTIMLILTATTDNLAIMFMTACLAERLQHLVPLPHPLPSRRPRYPHPHSLPAPQTNRNL